MDPLKTLLVSGQPAAKAGKDVGPLNAELSATAYLPNQIRGCTVLLQEADGRWRLTNDKVRSSKPNGVRFRRSKNMEDRLDKDLAWGAALAGKDHGDGWVQFQVPKDCLTVYLP